MTAEAGAVTGDLELLTKPAANGTGIEVLVCYVGAQDLYTVLGSPVQAVSEASEEGEEGDHRAAHERILGTLTTPGTIEEGNERPVDLLD
ncbi:MAG: hypothetical protein WA982_11380 [Rubrobacteraceae bacterium]